MVDVRDIARTATEATRRSVEIALALPRIALALERLAGATDDLRRLADTSDEVRRFLASATGDDLIRARETLQQLADAVGHLNGVVASLNTTVSPLQGATERLGRLVDRLPQGRRRVVDIEPGSAT